MAGKRCAIYCRVSSERQAADNKTSLESQEAHCRRACEERGYTVVEPVYREVISRRVNERPQLNQVRERVAAGDVDIMMSSVLDRLTGDQRHDYILMEEVERHGGRVEFALEKYDDTAIGRFLRSVRAFMAEVELEKLSFRVQQGINAKIMSGEPMGTIPLGYKKVGDDVLVDPLTAPTIRRIFELYANGASLYGVSAILQEEGHLTLRGKREWSTSAIDRILAGPGSPKFFGKWQGGMWGQRREKGKKTTSYLKPESERGPVFDGPAIITEELYNRANKRRVTAKANSPRRGEYPEKFLLRESRMRCGECGGKMHGITSRPSGRTPRRFYYQCATKACRKANIGVRQIDPEAWEICREVLGDPDVLLKRSSDQARDGSLNARIEQAGGEVKAAESEIDRLTGRLAIVPDSAAKKIVTRLEALDTRLQKATLELAELQSQAASRVGLEATRQRFIDWQRGVWARVDELTIDEKWAVLGELGVTVTVYDDGHDPRWTLEMRVAPWEGHQWGEQDWWRADPEGYAKWAKERGMDELTPVDWDGEVAFTANKTCALLLAIPRA